MTRDEYATSAARWKVREAAMLLAQRGLSAETIREAMRDMADTESDRAIEWADEYERREALADRNDVGDEWAAEALEERLAAE